MNKLLFIIAFIGLFMTSTPLNAQKSQPKKTAQAKKTTQVNRVAQSENTTKTSTPIKEPEPTQEETEQWILSKLRAYTESDEANYSFYIQDINGVRCLLIYQQYIKGDYACRDPYRTFIPIIGTFAFNYRKGLNFSSTGKKIKTKMSACSKSEVKEEYSQSYDLDDFNYNAESRLDERFLSAFLHLERLLQKQNRPINDKF